MTRKNAITDVPGLLVGHAQDVEALTGCTVVLCPKGAVAGMDQRGGAPGTRETDLLDPLNRIERVHAVLLTGGSAFGLDAAGGVMRFLEEKRIGFAVGKVRVPIVPAAVLYDLNVGRADVRPDAAMGYAACQSATAGMPAEGNFGAGTGASVGKLFGSAGAMKTGVGTASLDAGGGVIVGALAAVNAFGDVIDPQTGQILAGTRPAKLGPVRLGGKGRFADTLRMMSTPAGRGIMRLAAGGNTVLAVVATNARLTKAQAGRVAAIAGAGLARTIRPAFSMLDGDTIFALSTGNRAADVSTVGAYAAEALAQAILRAVWLAGNAGGLPGLAGE